MYYFFVIELLIAVFIIYASLSSCYAAQIFGIFPIKSRSHHSINQPLVKGLARRGHNVTIISHFKSVEFLENYTELIIQNEESMDFIDTLTVDEMPKLMGIKNIIQLLISIEKLNCKIILEHDYVQRALKAKEKLIDLIIFEGYFTECFNLLAVKLNVPIILVTPPSQGLGNDFMIGNVHNPSYVPLVFYTTNMRFFQRLSNFLQYLIYYIGQYTYFNYYMEDIAQKYFNTTMPNFEVLHKRVALTLFNNHYSLISKAKSPNAIDVAGIHIQQPKPLPQEIEEFIDGAEHGVIFFSFGSTIKASGMSKEKLNLFENVFRMIPQRVLWRIDDPRVINLSPNVKVSKWFPQRDILEHKNVKAFISHCGLFGTLESIYTATPVIGIPFLFDQHQDANIMVEKGMAISLDYSTLTEETLKNTINEIIGNPRYSEYAQALSNVFKDRLVSPLDEALYWVEYVIKYNGAPLLRTTAADMPLYQYLLLDVIFVSLVGLCIVVWIVKIILSILINSIIGTPDKTTKYKKC